MEWAYLDSALSEARNLWKAGRFEEASALLSNCASPAALIERARIAFFVHSDAESARDLLLPIDSQSHANEGLIAIAFRDLIASSCGSSSPSVQLSDFTDAGEEAISEASLLTATAAYARADYDSANHWLQSHTPQRLPQLARHLLIRGFVCGAKDQNFALQASLTEKALTLLLTEAPDESYLIASAAETLSYILRDIPSASGFASLARVNLNDLNTPGLIRSQFQILRALAWSLALEADYLAAATMIMRAAQTTSNPVLRMYSNLDLAIVCVFGGQPIMARAAFDLAHEVACKLDWASISKDHAEILPLAAHVAAEVGALPEAEYYSALAIDRSNSLAKHFNLSHGSRLRALVCEAAALASATRDPHRACLYAEEAYSITSRIGYEWRAGRMALLLHQLTRKGQWRDRAIGHLSCYPKSPFHRMLSVGTTQRTLTNQQQRILDLLRLGYSTQRIADELKRSPDTVRIHLGRLHRFFGVKNRHELLARLAQEITQAAG